MRRPGTSPRTFVIWNMMRPRLRGKRRGFCLLRSHPWVSRPANQPGHCPRLARLSEGSCPTRANLHEGRGYQEGQNARGPGNHLQSSPRSPGRGCRDVHTGEVGQMRRLACFQVGGMTVQEVLDEFNERAAEFGIQNEGDVVSVSALPPALGAKLPATKGPGLVSPRVEVLIVYWANGE